METETPETMLMLLMRFSRKEIVSFVKQKWPSFLIRSAPKKDLIRYVVTEDGGAAEQMLNNLEFKHLKKPELQEYLIRVCRHMPSFASKDCNKNDLIEKAKAENGFSPLEVLKAVQSDGEAISEVEAQPIGGNELEVLPAPPPASEGTDNNHRPATFVFPEYQIRYAKLVFEIGIDSFCAFGDSDGIVGNALLRIPRIEIKVVNQSGLDDEDFFSPFFDSQALDGYQLFKQRENAWLKLAEFLTPEINFIDSFDENDFPGDEWDWGEVGDNSDAVQFANTYSDSVHSMIAEMVDFSPRDVINGCHELEDGFTEDILLSLFIVYNGGNPLDYSLRLSTDSILESDWWEQWGHDEV